MNGLTEHVAQRPQRTAIMQANHDADGLVRAKTGDKANNSNNASFIIDVSNKDQQD